MAGGKKGRVMGSAGALTGAMFQSEGKMTDRKGEGRDMCVSFSGANWHVHPYPDECTTLNGKVEDRSNTCGKICCKNGRTIKHFFVAFCFRRGFLYRKAM